MSLYITLVSFTLFVFIPFLNNNKHKLHDLGDFHNYATNVL